jgi:dolichol-phosphate mannosyltransferase
VPAKTSIAVAIALSMLFNFGLNRRFSFSYARQGSWLGQLGGYVVACSLGAVINYAVSVWLLTRWTGVWPQVPALVGIIAGTGVNFVFCRFLVFRTAKAPSP